MHMWWNMAADRYLPYGRQQVDEDDIAAVVEVLRSDWLTTGPMVDRFERAVADYVGAKYAVAVSSGTAALHAAIFAIGVGPGDEVILPPMTFVATANAVVYQGGTPVFVDVEADTLLIDPTLIEEKITPRTKAIIAVDYAGQPCDYDALRVIADHHGLILVADACHSLGAVYKGRKVGTLADLTVFSFHPVKPITTGEGGMVVTDNEEWAERMRHFRNHGIDVDHRKRVEQVSWRYMMTELGYNYRLSDMQCALGLNQLKKLPESIKRRQMLATDYDHLLVELPKVETLRRVSDRTHGYHLYVIKLAEREKAFRSLRHKGVGCNVHYNLVHLQPYYRLKFGTGEGDCPISELVAEQILSLPIFSSMKKEDVTHVVSCLNTV